MHEHDAAEYGRHVAEDYDEIYGDLGDVEGAVARLVELVERSGGGPLLELGVGTGRLALPLVEAGVAVTGVDGSPAMLDHLLAKPGGDRVATVVGDFSTLDIRGRYAVIALVANTIYALPDQEAQVRTFRQAAAHLEPGGRFVVEAWVPPCLPAGPALLPRLLPPNRLRPRQAPSRHPAQAETHRNGGPRPAVFFLPAFGQ